MNEVVDQGRNVIGNNRHHARQGGSLSVNSISEQFRRSHWQARTAADFRHRLSLIRQRLILPIVVLLILGVNGRAQSQSSGRPLGQSQLQGLVKGGVASERLAKLVERRGIDFKPSEEYLEELRKAGAEEVLLKTLRALQQRAPAEVGGSVAGPVNHTSATSPSKQPTTAALVATHLARGAELQRSERWGEAEQEYRAASQLDTEDPAIHLALANVLSNQKRWAEAIVEFRETLRRRPNDTNAHVGLTNALEQKHDLTGAIAEYHHFLSLDPNDLKTLNKLAAALYAQGDVSGAIVTYRALVGLEPGDAQLHQRLGQALYAQADLDGAVREYNEALRLKPDFAEAHNDLGDALLKKGERRAALQEYLAAFELVPNDSTFRATSDWMGTHLEH
jgi:tetratricopeptide (TPR) repeat protein